jgi:hypothetical protein
MPDSDKNTVCLKNKYIFTALEGSACTATGTQYSSLCHVSYLFKFSQSCRTFEKEGNVNQSFIVLSKKVCLVKWRNFYYFQGFFSIFLYLKIKMYLLSVLGLKTHKYM